MKALRQLAAALAAALSLAASAGTYSDLWYNPQEAGWGLNVVQQAENAFVTLFVHGPDRQPRWYVSSNAQVSAYAGTQPIFRGTLYRTEGAPFTGPHAPGNVFTVGDIYLETLSRTRMRVHYRIDGTEYVKEVRRQTFAETPVTANYLAQFVLRQSRPGGPLYGTSIYQGDVLLHLDGESGMLMMRVDDHLQRRCEYRGRYEVAGKLTQASGTFTCTAGEALAGSFELTELETTANGITATLRTSAENHLQSGRFAAVRQ
jgi:hypothetical protein